MSQENFNSLQANIEGITNEETKIPNMPADKFLQEAEDLVEWSRDDKAQLKAVGVTAKLFTEMPVRSGALRYAQSVWMKERFTREEAQQEWDGKSPAAYDLKNELEHTFRYAFRNRPDLLNKIHNIEDGSGDADMVQDLSDLTVLGNNNTDLLAAINFDVTKLDTAEATSREMAQLLAASNGERDEGNIGKVTRDKAYTYLKQGVDEIREAGKYVFWKDKAKLKGYRSKFFRDR